MKFIRQYSIDGYVVDFYCPKHRLMIEVDGGIHDKQEQIIYDRYREKYLKAFDIRFLHFGNNEVLCDISNVVRRIKNISPLEARGDHRGDINE